MNRTVIALAVAVYAAEPADIDATFSAILDKIIKGVQ